MQRDNSRVPMIMLNVQDFTCHIRARIAQVVKNISIPWRLIINLINTKIRPNFTKTKQLVKRMLMKSN